MLESLVLGFPGQAQRTTLFGSTDTVVHRVYSDSQ